MTTSDWKRIRSGIAWTIFSPIILLMGLIAKASSDTEYVVGVLVCGTWSACGVASGIAKLFRARWAVPLQIGLCWVVFGVCSLSAATMAFAALRAFNSLSLGWLGIAATVFGQGFFFWIYARKRRRELKGEP